ncbi:mammalian cell entry protein [Mycobacterium sp. NPDC048908]|uniref:mammalian cell entry protein n=1 Tax=Mycobacterium sp. NPDC048908 TaxID=3364292 RepID=UPI0037115C55
MEDQPAGSGDLTTDAESLDQPSDPAKTPTGKAARRRHRMPLRQQLAASREDAEEPTAEEQPEPATAQQSEPVIAPRRRRLFHRLRKMPEPQAVTASTDEAAEPEAGAGQEAPHEDVIMLPHRAAGRRLWIGAAVAGAVFVAAAAFGGAMLQPYLADRALVHTKLDIAKTAANAITTLWTYTPDNMDSLPDRAAGYLGGDFATEYRKYIDAIVATNKQAQVTNTTQVMGTAVESVAPNEATALVYTNSVATSPGSKNIPSLRYLSYRLTLQRHDAKWLITRMSTVTSLDLTPQL